MPALFHRDRMTLGRAEVEGIAAGLESQVARLTHDLDAARAELDEVRQQQAASAEVLKVISRSGFELVAVLQTLVDSAIRLCGADMGAITLREGDSLRFKAGSAQTPELLEYERANPHPIGRGTFQGRAALSGRTIHVPDVLADAEYDRKEAALIGNFRAVLSVPLKRGEEVIGVFGMAKRDVGAFPERLIELVERFADKAVIAIENARLFEQVQSRNREIAEALEQQTATAEVLRVIASSPTDVRPVLESVVVSAAKLCEAYDAIIALREGGTLRISAHCGPVPVDFTTAPLTRGWVAGRSVIDRTTVQVADLSQEGDDYSVGREMALRLGHRTTLATPLILQGEAIGTLVLRRFEVKPFSDKQVELLKTFADQAVIAIDNARLFEAVQARSAELREALTLQTATADVLKLISRSTFDLGAVLGALAVSGARLCSADNASIVIRQPDGAFVEAANHGYSAAFARHMQDFHYQPDRSTCTGRVLLEGTTIQIPDALADPEYRLLDGLDGAEFRSVLGVPLLREGAPIGVFVLTRSQVSPFSDKQVEVVQTFADQAVIAIENVRLFEEVQARNREVSEALQQQTATGDILRVIASSPTDVQPVLEVIAESTARYCDTPDVNILLEQDGLLAIRAHHGPIPQELIAVAPSRDWVSGRAFVDRRAINVPDLLAAGDEFPRGRTMVEKSGIRSQAAVPLMQDQKAIGVIAVRRTEVRPFSDKQMSLLRTFADQAVIAIQNVRLFEEVQARNREVSEALQQQTATAEVLEVISRSMTDAQPVFDAILENAARLCDASFGNLTVRDGDVLRHVAAYGSTPEWAALHRENPILRPGPKTALGRLLATGSHVQIVDALEDVAYREGDPVRVQFVELFGARTILSVPMLKDGQVTGAITIHRKEVRPFNDKQIALLGSFASQAVIAVENARLVADLHARTTDLAEALGQQTATADVLKVISRSAFDLQSVLQTLIDSAARLCDANGSGIFLPDGDVLRIAASYSNSPEYDAYERAHPSPMSRASWVGRAALDKAIVHVPDVSRDHEHGNPEAALLGGYRSVLCVPLLRQGAVVGVFGLSRPHVGPFTDRQIELVKTFADQAVIAIENVRLFEQVQARTADLGEALQQQTATADVLKVISRSAFELQVVLDTLTESAVRLCRADKGALERMIDGGFQYIAMHGFPSGFRDYADAHPTELGRGSAVGRAIEERGIVHIEDIEKDPEYTHGGVAAAGGMRTVLAVPLFRQDELIGVFALIRTQPHPFSNREIELVKTFADQAVIAIENARLFEEVQARTAELSEALQQQTATADVLKVISRSAFDLQTVLETLVQSAVRLCNAGHGAVFRRHGDIYKFAAGYAVKPEVERMERQLEVRPGRGTAIGRAVLEKQVVQIADALTDPEYDNPDIAAVDNLRTILGVPLLGQDGPIGAFGLGRQWVEPFSEREIELVRTFADQAVIAIENVRLFEQVQARTRDLEESLRDLRTAQDRLVQTEKLASLGQLTAGIAHEIKNPLNFVNNFASLSNDLLAELSDALDRAEFGGPVRTELDELTGLLKGNLAKVEQHGKRADSIVKNMLLHSRQGSGEHRPTNINAVVEESLNLAYHGARAEKQGFNITLQRDLDPLAGDVDLFPQEITRVLLNLISNGFYATEKRAAQADGVYEPVLAAATRDLGDSVEIRIRDNGTGIPVEVKARMFTPFFTTKPAGEGTGLGLSLSHDIVVKQHAGTIEVETEPGQFTEFRIVLPRSAASLGQKGETA